MDFAKIILYTFLSILFWGCSEPDTNSILKEAKNVIGGSKSISKIYTSADCSGPSGFFQTQIWSGEKGFVRFEQQTSTDTTIAGINDVQAWTLSSEGVQEIDANLQAFLHGHELHLIALDPLSRFTNPIFSGESIFDERQALKIQFRDIADNKVALYYHSSEYKPLGMDLFNSPEDQTDNVRILFKDWKQLGNGLFYFTKATFLQGDEVWNYEYTAVEINNFDNAVFNP